MKSLIAKSVNDLPDIAQEILTDCKGQKVFALDAKMGAGKTTLIKSFCGALGVRETANSPTFALVNEYTTHDGDPVYHFDFYRIKKIEEVYDIGYEEYFYSREYCFMEWPELVEQLLPDTYVYLTIEVDENEERIISWEIKNN